MAESDRRCFFNLYGYASVNFSAGSQAQARSGTQTKPTGFQERSPRVPLMPVFVTPAWHPLVSLRQTDVDISMASPYQSASIFCEHFNLILHASERKIIDSNTG